MNKYLEAFKTFTQASIELSESLKKATESLKLFQEVRPNKIFAVTGTYHGSIITAKSEGEAMRIFHKFYGGESITHLKKLKFYY